MTDRQDLSRRIWEMKYRYTDPELGRSEASVDDTWLRVADALAAPEPDPSVWHDPLLDALRGFSFLPAGHILADIGTLRDVTHFNCFVMGEIPDDLAGIFSVLEETALTLQQGGATMSTLCCYHPDIESVIDTKRDPCRLRMFNVSVLVTDASMVMTRTGHSSLARQTIGRSARQSMDSRQVYPVATRRNRRAELEGYIIDIGFHAR